MNFALLSAIGNANIWHSRPATPDKLESSPLSSNGDRVSILTTPSRRRFRSKEVAIAKAVVLGFTLFVGVFIVLGSRLPEIGQNLPDPDAALRMPAPTSHLGVVLRSTRKAFARKLINLGRFIDAETLVESAPSKGYIKKALDKSREELKDKDDQRTELQRFYESEIHRLSRLLEEEDQMVKEVLGEDFDGTIDASRLHHLIQ